MTRNPHTHITRLYEFPIAPASPAPWGGLGRGPISCTRYLAGSFSYAKAFQRSRMRASGSHLPLKVHLAVMA